MIFARKTSDQTRQWDTSTLSTYLICVCSCVYQIAQPPILSVSHIIHRIQHAHYIPIVGVGKTKRTLIGPNGDT